MYVILTFDVESCLGDEEITQALPYTLDILSNYPRVKCTFNVSARSVCINREAVHRISDEGHEIAAHGYRHDMDWETKDKNEQEELIIKAKTLLQSKLGTEIVGWATPRGNKHSADVGLLKKHGFLYVRDRSYTNYHQFILPEVSAGFADIPRFGYDETTFMKTSFIEFILKKTVLSNRFFKRRPDWQHHQIYQYLRNMLDYKMDLEQTYLVTNLHPCHIWGNTELEIAFVRFLDYLCSKDNVRVMPAKDFAKGLINREIILKESGYHADSLSIDVSYNTRIESRNLPEVALVFNSSPARFSGLLTIKVGLIKALVLSVIKYTGFFKLVCGWSKRILSYRVNLLRRQLTVDVSLPPYSTSIYYIGMVRHS